VESNPDHTDSCSFQLLETWSLGLDTFRDSVYTVLLLVYNGSYGLCLLIW